MLHLTAGIPAATTELIREVVIERARLDAVRSRKYARSEVRYAVRTRVAWSPLPPAGDLLRNPTDAWCCDISTGGLGLLTSAPLRSGSRLYIDLRPLSPKGSVISATVAHCTALVPGVYQVGVHFDA